MPATDSLARKISRSLVRRYQPCPELQSMFAKNKGRFKTPILADMLQALPWECQRHLVNAYGENIPMVEYGIFDPIAKKWFSSAASGTGHGRYALINDLKGLLRDWGFHDFYERHRDVLAVNMNDELFSQLNAYYCLEEVFESQINLRIESGAQKKSRRVARASRDPRPEMIATTARTFFFASMFNLQLKWMLELMDLAYNDGSMGAGLDSEEYEMFHNLYQAVGIPSVDELMDTLDMFPPHASKESMTALRLLLKNAEDEIRLKVRLGRRNVARKKAK